MRDSDYSDFFRKMRPKFRNTLLSGARSFIRFYGERCANHGIGCGKGYGRQFYSLLIGSGFNVEGLRDIKESQTRADEQPARND